MAVSSTTARDPAPAGPAPTGTPSEKHSPIRTCIGCRKRAAAAELLRVVAAGCTVIPDPRHRAAGRGAWLHHDPVCVDLAERRRAFGRALRVSGPLDPTPVREHVASPEAGPCGSGQPDARPEHPTSGQPQE